MIRSRFLLITNPYGAISTYAVGQYLEKDGELWRITRHVETPTTPWGTIRVYGKRVRS